VILKGPYQRNRLPAYGKAFYVRSQRGQLVVCSWPRKRGRNLHPKTLEQMEKFRQANILVKYVAPSQMIISRELTPGTGLYPNDLIISAMYGRLFSFQNDDGLWMHSMSAVSDASLALDIMGQLSGSILVRGATLWEPVRAGEGGWILVSQTPPLPPVWQAGVSSGSPWTTLSDVTLTSNLAVGQAHVVVVPSSFQELEFDFHTTNSQQNIHPVMRVNNNVLDQYTVNVNSQVNGGAFQTLHFGGNLYLDMFNPAGLPALKAYAVHAKIVKVFEPPQYAIQGTGWNNIEETTQFGGRSINTGSGIINTLEFLSIAGVGLQAGMRISVRACI